MRHDPFASASHQTFFRFQPPINASRRRRDLLSRLRAAMSRPYEVLVRQYSGRMLAVARRFLRLRDESADAVQEAFCSAFQAIDSFEGRRRSRPGCIASSSTLPDETTNSSRRPTVSIDDLLRPSTRQAITFSPVASWSRTAVQAYGACRTQNQVVPVSTSSPTTTAWCFCSAT